MGVKVNSTQKEIITNHLKEYGYITLLDAVQKYKICRLSAIIQVLRQEGYCILTLMKNGQYNKYAKYVLIAEPGKEPKLIVDLNLLTR